MTDTDKIGTLNELDVKPGDVVELVSAMPGFENYVSKHKGREFVGVKGGAESRCGEYHFSGQSGHVFRLISRATPPLDLTEITTPFGLLPPETQKALRDHGGPYEVYLREGWWKIEPVLVPQLTYRVKTAPKRETVTIYGAPALGVQWVYTQCEHDTHRITFDIIDGKPDPASIRMEEL